MSKRKIKLETVVSKSLNIVMLCFFASTAAVCSYTVFQLKTATDLDSINRLIALLESWYYVNTGMGIILVFYAIITLLLKMKKKR